MDFSPGDAEHRRLYATFAKAAYDGADKAVLPEGYVTDIAYSNRNQVLSLNHEKKHAILAFRGTDLTNVSKAVGDLADDALLATGLKTLSSRFRGGVRAAKAVRIAYPEYSLAVTGFSLGGSTAAHVHSKVKDTDYVGFSTHIPVREATQNIAWGAIDALIKKPNRKRATNYITAADAISWTAATAFDKNTFIVPQTAKSAHSLNNFLA